MIRTALMLSALIAAPAFAENEDTAASLTAQQGTVLVNQGDEFVTALPAQALKAGDRVLVMEGGSAELTFTDGCVLPLEAGSMLEVPALSTCAGTVANVQSIGPSYAQAVGAPGNNRNGPAPYVFGAWGLLIAAFVNQGYSIEGTPAAVSP